MRLLTWGWRRRRWTRTRTTLNSRRREICLARTRRNGRTSGIRLNMLMNSAMSLTTLTMTRWGTILTRSQTGKRFRRRRMTSSETSRRLGRGTTTRQ